MSKKKKQKKSMASEESKEQLEHITEQETATDTELSEKSEESKKPEVSDESGKSEGAEAPETPETIIEKLQAQVAQEKKEYLFLMADFDNYRKRTLKEKQELLKNGAERAMLELLPVVDDFERAISAMNNGNGDAEAMKEGIMLIYNKFIKYLEHNNVKAIESTGNDFDTDLHEAITMFPAPSPELKGKVVDTTLKGYMINDKVLRHAKVVVGQ